MINDQKLIIIKVVLELSYSFIYTIPESYLS